MHFKQRNSLLFFSIWVFFHEHSQITGLQGKEESIPLTTHDHFHPLHRQLDMGQAITALSQQPDSNREPLAFERQLLTTKLRALILYQLTEKVNSCTVLKHYVELILYFFDHVVLRINWFLYLFILGFFRVILSPLTLGSYFNILFLKFITYYNSVCVIHLF